MNIKENKTPQNKVNEWMFNDTPAFIHLQNTQGMNECLGVVKHSFIYYVFWGVCFFNYYYCLSFWGLKKIKQKTTFVLSIVTHGHIV